MKVYRIQISAWTASFRYPNMISSYQPTLAAPPLSTINGLISAAMGDYFVVTNEKIGYVFTYRSKTVDLETVYQMGRSLRGIKSNVIKREFLSDVELYLYTDSPEIANALRAPKFQILLGRSGDLARVDSIEEIEIEEKKGLSKVIGTVVPFKKHSNIAAPIQALPMSFTNTMPRRNIGTQPYFIIDGLVDGYKIKKGYRKVDALGFSDDIDEVRSWDVYWQEID